MSGFKYLGYHLKLGASKTEDWIWLVSKLEKKIGLWLNKWLSLGGRYVLVKTVLESQTVFWMSFEEILRSILNKIHKLMFDFLWNGSKDKHQFPLVRWEILVQTKKLWWLGILKSLSFQLSITCKYTLAGVDPRWHLAQNSNG
jgi:hypothetical protein